MYPNTIQLNGVTKVFRTGDSKIEAVSKVTLSLPSGAFYIIAGASGSGKTTLLNLIGGLECPTEGTITCGPKNLDQMNENDLAIFRRYQVGFIFQGNNLIPTLTAAENVEIPLILTNAKDRQKKVEAILEEVGLGDKQNMFPQYLSIGEQQRIAIARAVVHSPEIILADEPTANIDSRTSDHIFMLLQRLNQKLNRTVLFSTHDTRLIAKSDRVIRLEDGRVVQV